MSLASVQSDIDAALASLLASIDSAQATYFAANGIYFQGLLSHKTIPSDGGTVAADNLSATPSDQAVTWATFGVTPGTIPAAVRCSTYKSQVGYGYRKQVVFIYAGAMYSKQTDSGNDSASAYGWGTTPDPVPPEIPAPTFSSCTASTGSTAGGTSVTIAGTGFQSGATVTFGGSSATSVVVVSGTSITCATPAHSAGAVDIVITNPDAKTVTGASGFTYANPYGMVNTFNTVGTFAFKAPAWVNGMDIELWAGGGGGASPTGSVGGGGGVGGAYGKKAVTPSAGDSIAYVVPAGGVGVSGGGAGGNGANGDNATCTTYSMVATGGYKGNGNGTNDGASVATGCDVSESGGVPAATSTTTGATGGTGAHSGGAGGTGGVTGNGGTPSAPGGGGGGGAYFSATRYAGTSGAKGRVRFSCSDPSQPTYIQGGTGSASGAGDISVAFSATPYQGSLVVAVVWSNSGAGVTPTQSGWTQLNSGTTGKQVFWRLVDETWAAGKTGTFDYGGSAKADKCLAAMVEVYGSSVTAVDANAASTSTANTPSVTTTVANDLVLSLGASDTPTDFATQPAGWTAGPAQTGAGVATIAYKTFAAVGATGTAAWSTSGGKLFTVAVKA